MEIVVKISGIQIKKNTLYALNIEQKFNQHHQFECKLYAEAKTGFSATTDNLKKWLGSAIIITLQNLSFKGVISETSTFLEKGKLLIILKGHSPTILLESYGGDYNSYNKKNLTQILETVKKRVSGSQLKWKISPSYHNAINYITQYNESNFAFLNRLSAVYGELFYYDGEELYFGRPTRATGVDLYNKSDITELNISIRASPVNFHQYSYNYVTPNESISAVAPEISLSNELAQHAYNRSKLIFNVSATSPADAENTNTLEALQRIRRKAIASGLATVEGKSNSTHVAIGAQITIKERNVQAVNTLGKFLITMVKHSYASGKYSNTFSGVWAGTEVLDVDHIAFPVAEQQVGKVISNSDPLALGRVKVRMLWQDAKSSTDWIRILAPNAGDDQRGILFIPAPGDEVILGFQYGDPDQPFVMGSVYNRNRQPDIETTEQAIRTKEGSRLFFFRSGKRREMGIVDSKNNSVVIDTSNNSIHVRALGSIKIKSDKISIKARELEIDATEAVDISAKDMNMKVGGQYTTVVEMDYLLTASDITEIAEGDFTCISGNDMTHYAVNDATFTTENGNIMLNASEEVRFKGKKTTH